MGGVIVLSVRAWFVFAGWKLNAESLAESIAAMHDDLSIETNLVMTDHFYTVNPHMPLEHNATLTTWWMVRRSNFASANETLSRLMSIGPAV